MESRRLKNPPGGRTGFLIDDRNDFWRGGGGGGETSGEDFSLTALVSKLNDSIDNKAGPLPFCFPTIKVKKKLKSLLWSNV